MSSWGRRDRRSVVAKLLLLGAILDRQGRAYTWPPLPGYRGTVTPGYRDTGTQGNRSVAHR